MHSAVGLWVDAVEIEDEDLWRMEISGELDILFNDLGCKGLWGAEFERRRTFRLEALINSLEEGALRSGGGAFIASLRSFSVALITSVARIAFSLGESCSETSLGLPFVGGIFVCLARDFVAVGGTLGFRPVTVFTGCFDIDDGSIGSELAGLVRRRSFNNFGIAGVISPVETAFLMVSTESIIVIVMVSKKDKKGIT